MADFGYDKHVDFYYTNLINSLVLFSLTATELEQLREPGFDPLFEFEAEIDYAFTPVCFETIFRNHMVHTSLKDELLLFKKQTENIPMKIWDWEFIDHNEIWIVIRNKANELLDKLGIKKQVYNHKYITMYDSNGNKIKR